MTTATGTHLGDGTHTGDGAEVLRPVAFGPAVERLVAGLGRRLAARGDPSRLFSLAAPGRAGEAAPSAPEPLVGDLDPGDPLAVLRDLCVLDDLELDLLVVALAPEVDREAARLLGYLQDDPSLGRACLGEALDLLRPRTGGATETARSVHQVVNGPLVTGGLVQLVAPTAAAPLSAHLLVPAPDLLGVLLGERPLVAAAEPEPHRQEAGGLLGQPLESDVRWHDLVVPRAAEDLLHELCLRVRHKLLVLEEWGFGRGALGRGTVALFSGPPGTGKTLAARVVAADLDRPVHRVDLGQVLDKYIGETEKNLDRVFAAAAESDAVLLFDEADALFGRRTEVRDSHDRYANHEVSHLLNRVEEYDGLALLTTNLVDNVDAAFVRRLAFHVRFPFPNLAARAEIWARTWPGTAPLDPGVDLASLAEHRLSGAGIRDAALTAAFLAAADGGVVTATHLETAVRRELTKAGRLLREDES